ncbi:MAG TPA: hypothetical protein VH650_11885 [Gaiellaceae bacterium]|jgi:hypothetical protein
MTVAARVALLLSVLAALPPASGQAATDVEGPSVVHVTAARVPVYTRTSPPATPALADLPRRSSVTKDGITWRFSRPKRVGRFVTGDWYVVGSARVRAITPKPAGGRNGSVRNIPGNDVDTGFDRRTDGNRYEPKISLRPPISLRPGNSLVSSISVRTVGSRKRWLFDKATGSPVRTVSILTSVAAPLPPDAFRPSYAGHGRIYYSRNLRRDLLPTLASVGSTPSLAEYTAHFRRPWIDNVMFNFDAPIAYMPDYAREIARAVGNAGLLLSLDYTRAQKEPLLVYLTQYGIDLAGLVRRGHDGWHAHGGHGSGRKFPIVFAGVMLDDASMKSPQAHFGEDMQTMTGTGWTGATALYAGHYGEGASGEYGPYEHLQPRDWISTLGEDYRRCCTSSAWIAEALAARLIPGAMAAWDYAPFFLYADRWMTENDLAALAAMRSQIGADYSSFPQRRAWDRFATDMWSAYR